MRISDWSSDVCSSDLHVPHGSDLDITDLYERQIERYAPGFRDVVIARSVPTSSWYQAHNANLIGGAIAGGPHGGLQLVMRPRPGLHPYRPPNPRLFLCLALTPPAGGVHGIFGYPAAHSALSPTPPPPPPQAKRGHSYQL